jgi:outer membrane autotransporter protein
LRSSHLTIENAAPTAWDQLYGQASRQAQTDALSGSFASPGIDEFKGPAILTLQSSSGHVQRVGLVGGTSQFLGNSDGLLTNRAMADPGNDTLNLQGQSLGAYWSLTGPQGWHVDLSASGGRVAGFSRNDQGARIATEGSAVTLSVEGGFPIGVSENWVVEPQAQLINQRITLDTPYAGSSNASSSDLTSWSGRVGARLKGSYDINGLGVEPYVRTNLWHTVYTGNTVTLDQVDKISSSRNSSTVEVGLGLVARVTPAVSFYVSADYSSDVDENDLNGLIGSLGVRMRW